MSATMNEKTGEEITHYSYGYATQVVVLGEDGSIERIVAGLEKKNRLLNPQERERVAYHEMGHAIVALSLPGTDPVEKISIIPRGIAALGCLPRQFG
mgnify:CR=1 FL=1